MRIITSIFIVTFLLACSTKNATVDNDFEQYLESLDLLQTPVSFNVKRGLKAKSLNYDKALFKKFKQEWSVGPQGKLFDKDSVVLVVEILAGDMVVPLLRTFDREGRPLDSLNPYIKSGVDMGFECYEFVTVTDKKEIIVTDSTRNWDLNAEKTKCN